MSDLEAEIISSQSSRLEIKYHELARLGGVESLARILGLNSNIKELDLNWCKIGDEKARVIAVAEMLKVNSTLLKVHLGENRIGDMELE